MSSLFYLLKDIYMHMENGFSSRLRRQFGSLVEETTELVKMNRHDGTEKRSDQF